MLRSYRSIITLRLKQSFSMIELASYVAVMGALVVVATGGLSVIKNARVHKVVSELYFYENALSDFVIKYGELPGNMSMERCLMFNEFKDFCQTLQISSGDIMDASTTLNSNKQAFVAMNNNIMGQIMALNYGRFLKTSGIIDSVSTGIDKELETTNLRDGRIKKYLPKVGIGDGVYMHYMYNNSTNRWNDGFIFTESINDETGKMSNIGMNLFSFSDDTEGAVIVLFSTLGRYIDIEKGGAFSANFMGRIDKKIDDGRPRTGYLVGLPQGADGQNVANTCDDGVEYFEGSDDRNFSIKYHNDDDTKNGCNLAYLSSINFADMLANPKYFG